jgi:hypothetical protein
MFCIVAVGCNSGGSNTNNTTSTANNTTSNANRTANSATGNASNQAGAGNSQSPTTSSSPTASPMPLPNALSGASAWVQTATNVKGQIGQRFTYTCPPNTRIYEGVSAAGDVYYTGSSLCSAAIHAGVITQAQGGQITFEIRPAPATVYPAGEARNGVTPRAMSFNNQNDNGGFVFVRP